MKVLTIDSLSKISDHVNNNPEDRRLVDDFKSMSEELGLVFIEVPYELDIEKIELQHPSADLDAKTTDAINSVRVYECFRDLSPAQATDQRLWITLCFMHFNDYVLSRWQWTDEKKIAISIRNHWTFGGERPQFRDNAISRLWWTGFIVTNIPGWDEEDASKLLYDNSDYFNQVILRPSSTMNIAVLQAILAITKEAYDSGSKYEKKKFVVFMKEVNFLAGRTNLAVLTLAQIIQLLKPAYTSAHASAPMQKIKEKLGIG